MQLSNAITSTPVNSAYRVFVDDETGMGNVTAGAVVTTLMKQVTGTAVDLMVHPYMPQGNSIVRQFTLPLPDSNISETFAMSYVQDYGAINWPPAQFTYDQSTITISTLCSYPPTFSALV
jgi:hypothetical protein